MVAKRVKNFLPPKLSQHWEIKILPKPETETNSMVHRSVCTGTTALTLAQVGEDLIIGDFGESIAVLEMRGANKALVPVQLTLEEDELLILGTHNAWEVLSEENMACHMEGCTVTSCLARGIVNVASRRCGYKYRCKVPGDPQVVCLFLNSHHSDIATKHHTCSRPQEFVERRWR
ncbi:uncharacterized protein LOC125208002 [Salvia hispanica]|uniref:uncharacterized protein LOC125208002 n=1 Tax=Salvia hispanica TaxID=49212 RepID=UPI002009B06F|nr:uncharacterized protein LOC125208002 [Salvia hispanica]